MDSPTPPTVKLAWIKTPKSNKRKIYEVFFKTVHFISLLDFGFFNSNSVKTRKLCKSIIIIALSPYFSIIILFFIYRENNYIFIVLLLFIITFTTFYFVTVIVLALTCANRSFDKLVHDLQMIDENLYFDNKPYELEFKIVIIILLHFGSYFIMLMFAYMYTFILSFDLIYYHWIHFCLNEVYIIIAFVFYLITCRLKKLTLMIKTAESNFSSLQKYYKTIVDVADTFTASFDSILTLGFFAYTAQVLGDIILWLEIYNMHSDVNRIIFIVGSIVTIKQFIIIFSPAICAEILVTQVDKIRFILEDKLLLTTDERTVQELQKFSEYTKARSCRYYMCHVIPVDASLPGCVLGFCVTYVIVFAQFRY